jgi:LysM repeat protein
MTMRFAHFIIIRSFLILFSGAGIAQSSNSKLVLEYVAKYKDIAQYEMLRAHIPASITLAQGILESQCGASRLATEGHNHFGVKCKANWTGKVILEDDDDFQECFRFYETVAESYRDHSDFLLSTSRYSYLFDLELTDYKSWAYGLKEAGYATNPAYATQLIDIIEKYNLKQYDKIVKPVAVKDTAEKHAVVETNGIPSTTAKEHDTYSKIAVENNMKVKDLMTINDQSDVKALRKGDLVYLKTKRNENTKYETHKVETGESMRDISQVYGVKLSLLLERNGLEPGEEPSKGEVITLNKKNKNTVKTRKPANYGKQVVDMRIRMGERTQTDSIIEAKYNSEAAQEAKVDSEVAVIPVVPVTDTLYVGNPNRNDLDPEDKLDEVVNNEMYHFVKKGETLYSISKKYAATVEELKSWNKLKDNYLKLHQRIQVTNYALLGMVMPKVYAMDNKGIYTIQEGDSLKEIAFNFGISIDDILRINNMSTADTLKVGSKLRVLKPDYLKIAPPPVYIVQAGDTLSSISRKYDITIAEIKRLNSLYKDAITVGMKLYLQ